MPYRFNFYVDKNIEFSCILKSDRCEFIKKDGERCKLKTIIGTPYCHIHLKYEYHLTIKKSNLQNAGKGLFAFNNKKGINDIVFKKGDKIIEYKGELISNEELTERYNNFTAPYALQINKNEYQDCSCNRGVGSIANTYPNHNNSTFTIFRNKAFIKATKNIRNNEEIYVSYGKSYHLDEENVKHETKYIRNF
jgi:cyclophilin family peptidyl-prolyl cis-trans isomerase